MAVLDPVLRGESQFPEESKREASTAGLGAPIATLRFSRTPVLRAQLKRMLKSQVLKVERSAKPSRPRERRARCPGPPPRPPRGCSHMCGRAPEAGRRPAHELHKRLLRSHPCEQLPVGTAVRGRRVARRGGTALRALAQRLDPVSPRRRRSCGAGWPARAASSVLHQLNLVYGRAGSSPSTSISSAL